MAALVVRQAVANRLSVSPRNTVYRTPQPAGGVQTPAAGALPADGGKVAVARGVAYTGAGGLGTQGMRTGSPMRSKPNGVGLAARRSASLTPYCAAMVAHRSPGWAMCCSHSASGGQTCVGDRVGAGVCARSGVARAAPRLTATNHATMHMK